jgi:DNA-binding transcriptional LysR family regulator
MADFKAIETFMWVATLGSFRGAAQKLNTTQPAISQRIAQLEREVGVKLLQRDRRMVLPTPSGRQLMVYAEKRTCGPGYWRRKSNWRSCSDR